VVLFGALSDGDNERSDNCCVRGIGDGDSVESEESEESEERSERDESISDRSDELICDSELSDCSWPTASNSSWSVRRRRLRRG
jgi:hypothetical protein